MRVVEHPLAAGMVFLVDSPKEWLVLLGSYSVGFKIWVWPNCLELVVIRQNLGSRLMWYVNINYIITRITYNKKGIVEPPLVNDSGRTPFGGGYGIFGWLSKGVVSFARTSFNWVQDLGSIQLSWARRTGKNGPAPDC